MIPSGSVVSTDAPNVPVLTPPTKVVQGRVCVDCVASTPTPARTSAFGTPVEQDFATSNVGLTGLPSKAVLGPLFHRPVINVDSSSVPFVPGLSPPPVAAPIPGPLSGSTHALSDDSLMSSLVYNADRLANPDVVVKPGTIEGIRRIGEIHVFVARASLTIILWPLGLALRVSPWRNIWRF